MRHRAWTFRAEITLANLDAYLLVIYDATHIINARL